LFNEDELEDDDYDINENLESEIVEVDQIPQHEVYVLIMTNDIDLSEPIFNDESEEIEDKVNEKSNINNSELSEDENEFDIDEILANTSFKY
jgi:hypothetical protein